MVKCCGYKVNFSLTGSLPGAEHVERSQKHSRFTRMGRPLTLGLGVFSVCSKCASPCLTRFYNPSIWVRYPIAGPAPGGAGWRSVSHRSGYSPNSKTPCWWTGGLSALRQERTRRGGDGLSQQYWYVAELEDRRDPDSLAKNPWDWQGAERGRSTIKPIVAIRAGIGTAEAPL